MMNMFFNDLSDLLWNGWPVVKSYRYEVKSDGSTKSKEVDSRIEWFKSQSYDTMDKTIKDLESLLTEMKELRKSKLDKEISDTEERLKNLKSSL